MATLSAAISKSLLSKLPTEASTKFNLDETEFKEFLQSFLSSQLGKAAKGGRAAGPKGTNGKGRISGYILFSNENRVSVKESKDLAFTEVGKELGQMWRALSAEEQAEWNNRANERNVANGLPTPTPGAKKETVKKSTTTKKGACKTEKAPAAKKTAAKKDAGDEVTVTRHQASKSWVIQGTEFVVTSLKNKAVIGKLRANKVMPLSPSDRKKVAEKGWQVAEATTKVDAKESSKKAPAKKTPAKRATDDSDDSDSR